MARTRVTLVTRGDDSGACHSANVAIRDACTEGILRNTSIIVPGPAFEEAAEMYRDMDDLCVGLHATVTAEWDAVRWGPVLGPDKVPSLVDEDGHFPTDTHKLNDMEADPDEMMREIQAQLEMARAHGLDIAYIDTHMGFGWVRGIGDRVKKLASEQGLLTWDNVLRLPRPDGEFDSAVHRVIAGLKAAEPGTYLIVGHPVYPEQDVLDLVTDPARGRQVAADRDWQRRMFMDPDILDFCEAHGVEAARFTDVASA